MITNPPDESRTGWSEPHARNACIFVLVKARSLLGRLFLAMYCSLASSEITTQEMAPPTVFQLSNLLARVQMSMPQKYAIEATVDATFQPWDESRVDAEARKQTELFADADKHLTDVQHKKQFEDLKQAIRKSLDGDTFYRVREWRYGKLFRLDKQEAGDKAEIMTTTNYDLTYVFRGDMEKGDFSTFRINWRLGSASIENEKSRIMDSATKCALEIDDRIRWPLLLSFIDVTNVKGLKPRELPGKMPLDPQKLSSAIPGSNPKVSISVSKSESASGFVDHFVISPKGEMASGMRIEITCDSANYNRTYRTRLLLSDATELVVDRSEYGSDDFPRAVIKTELKSGRVVKQQRITFTKVNLKDEAAPASVFAISAPRNFHVEDHTSGRPILVQTPPGRTEVASPFQVQLNRKRRVILLVTFALLSIAPLAWWAIQRRRRP